MTIRECVGSCKFYPKLCLISCLMLTKSTRVVNLEDVPLLNVTSDRPYATAEVTEFPENYQNLQLLTSFSRERNFA